MKRAKRWLVASALVHNVYGEGKDLYERARRAMYAAQIICPSGGLNVYLKLQHTSDGYDIVGECRPTRMCHSFMGRACHLEDNGFQADFEVVYQGVERAFREELVRLQNPILLLEHGAQTGNAPLSTLFFVMGLDMLLMAPELDPFVERLRGFLGSTSFVFPKTSLRMESQPKYRVGEVAEDVYKVRNIIGHGREIPKSPYREDHFYTDDQGRTMYHKPETYLELLQQSALFMLCSSLRKIFKDGMFDAVKDESAWKQHLNIAARVEESRNPRKPQVRTPRGKRSTPPPA